jgi:non-specific serine/threonine protein kinase
VSLVTQRLGILAVRGGDERLGVRLLGTAHDAEAGLLSSNAPELVHERRKALDQARATLGEAAFRLAWAAGREQTLEEAAAEALALAPPPGTPPEPLTARQREVAALVARGLTNRQIGERLSLSPHTVERHVENILNRLGLSSRAQIAAWAVQDAQRVAFRT